MNEPLASKPSLHFTLATAGHVDHGKTSVLRALTGIDPDRLKEEKERQMTTDLGFAHLRIDTSALDAMGKETLAAFESKLGEIGAAGQTEAELVVGFIDVPGHGKFLKNMLAGVGGIDLALIVVAADEGPMPQTIQHVKILSLLGVKKCVIVLTKIDLVGAEEQQLAVQEIHDLVGRLGIEVLETAPVSAVKGNGIENLKAAIVRQVLQLPARNTLKDSIGEPLPAYLPVDRVFSKSGYGVVVTGTLVYGLIKVGDNVFIEPGHAQARVRGLETFNRKLSQALPGQRLAVNMSLKENRTLERGDAIVARKSRCTKTLVVRLTDLGGIESRLDSGHVKLKPQEVRLYHGTAERAGTLRWIETLTKPEGDESPAAEFADLAPAESKGARAFFDRDYLAQISLSDPIMVNPGERFVIRYGDYGVAGGDILVTFRPRWLTRNILKEIAEHAARGELELACTKFINSAPQRSIDESELDFVLSEVRRQEVVAHLLKDGSILRFGHQLITKDEKKDLEDTILSKLKDNESESTAGTSQESLRVGIAPLLDRTVFQNIIKELLERGAIAKDGERIFLVGRPTKKITVQDSKTAAAIMELLEKEICLEIAEVCGRTGHSDKTVRTALDQLAEQERVAIVSHDFVSPSGAVQKAHEVLASIWSKKRNIAPGDFREELGTTRKYAMALLAYFDDCKITRRLQSGRVLLKAPAK